MLLYPQSLPFGRGESTANERHSVGRLPSWPGWCTTYLNRSNRDLADFLAGLRYEDYALTFGTQAMPATAGQLRAALNQINQSFRQLSRRKEAGTRTYERCQA